jgi:aerobic-type carbon monoxide dehydrogenase small subunit (CoxS/CutS family)
MFSLLWSGARWREPRREFGRGTVLKPRIKPRLPERSTDPRCPVALTVNGEKVEREVSVRMLLSDFLRHELGLTGTHVGCEHGVCGACTIMINGRAARSCLTFAVQVAGTEVRTIESVADPNGDLHPLQQAFQDCHALQCGYCTPGIIMNVLSWFETSPNLDLSDEGVREMLSGNLCRCTGYQNIVTAVCQAAEAMRLGRGS